MSFHFLTSRAVKTAFLIGSLFIVSLVLSPLVTLWVIGESRAISSSVAAGEGIRGLVFKAIRPIYGDATPFPRFSGPPPEDGPTPRGGVDHTVNVRGFGAKGDGRADDTAAIQAAISSVGRRTYRGRVYIPAGVYRITSSLTLGGGGTGGISKPIIIEGDGQATQLINMAPPGNPTFAFRGVAFFQVRHMLLSGDSAHANDAILLDLDERGNQCARFLFQGVVTEPAGRGFVLKDTNSGVLRDCKHWPSSNANGATIPPPVKGADIKHGIHMTGKFCNDISIYDFDASTDALYSPEYCAIKCDPTIVANRISIVGGVLEGAHLPLHATQWAISLRKVAVFNISGVYAENATFKFDACSFGVISAIDKAGDGGTWITGSSNRLTFVGVLDDSLKIDLQCGRNMFLNCSYDAPKESIVDHGVETMFMMVESQGIRQPDKGMHFQSP